MAQHTVTSLCTSFCTSLNARAAFHLPTGRLPQPPRPIRPRAWPRFLACCLASMLLCTTGCAALYPTPPSGPTLDAFPLRRFDRVDGEIYRSGQPSAEQLQQLTTRYGIRTIIKLNRGSDPAPPGVAVRHFPLDVLREPTPQQLSQIVEAIATSPKPLLIHCTHGEDRTGLIVALYRVHQGGSPDAAFTDMMRHGFHPYRGVYAAWLRSQRWGDL